MNKTKLERFTYGEELANAISHLTGAALGVAALVFMVVFSAKNGTAWHITTSAVFGGTMVLLYLSSTLNHWLPKGKGKEFFFTFDKIAIYLLIAGTYTPISLLAVRGTLGWTIFAIEWSFALAGILIQLFRPTNFQKGVESLIVISYVIMGWIAIIAIPQLSNTIGTKGLLWIAIGGIFYMLGIIFFKLEKIKFHHLIWHLFVIGGSVGHFIVVYFYVLPIN